MSAAPPYHPQTQGKIERWHHDSLKNRILLEHYYLPGDLERQVRGPSWRVTTMPAITRASTILPQLTSTAGALRPSSSNAKGSSARQSKTVACSISGMPHNLNLR